MEFYRATLFERTLKNLVVKGGFSAAYLMTGEGLYLAAVPPTRLEEPFAALATSAMQTLARAPKAGLFDAHMLTIHREFGGAVVFYYFYHKGDTEGTFIIAALAEKRDYYPDVIPAAARQIQDDLREFY